MQPHAITLADARFVTLQACSDADVILVTPQAPSFLRGAVRAAIAATTTLTLAEVEQRVSFYVPEIPREIIDMLPASVLGRFAIDDRPTIYLSEIAWNDPIILAGVIAHELGHAAQDKAAARMGTLARVAHGVAYLLCDVARADDEATCYVADMTAKIALSGASPEACLAGCLEAMAFYHLDEHAIAHARAVLESASASLACGVYHGAGTPIQGITRALAARGVDTHGF